MFATSKLIAVAATFLFSQSLASVIPASSVEIIPRGGGFPASNPPGVTCYNTWETVTNDSVLLKTACQPGYHPMIHGIFPCSLGQCVNNYYPFMIPVVQYWYIVITNAENSVKADRLWNHLNLNDCAPTENKYHVQSEINGCAITFHASEACTANAVSHAIRSSSDPAMNVACAFTDKEGVDPGEAAATAGDEAIELILEGLGDAFGGE